MCFSSWSISLKVSGSIVLGSFVSESLRSNRDLDPTHASVEDGPTTKLPPEASNTSSPEKHVADSVIPSTRLFVVEIVDDGLATLYDRHPQQEHRATGFWMLAFATTRVYVVSQHNLSSIQRY